MAISESSTISSDTDVNEGGAAISENQEGSQETRVQRETTLLDLYSGCGAMSTGLCMGAQLSGLNLVTVRHFSLLIIFSDLFNLSILDFCYFK